MYWRKMRFWYCNLMYHIQKPVADYMVAMDVWVSYQHLFSQISEYSEFNNFKFLKILYWVTSLNIYFKIKSLTILKAKKNIILLRTLMVGNTIGVAFRSEQNFFIIIYLIRMSRWCNGKEISNNYFAIQV